MTDRAEGFWWVRMEGGRWIAMEWRDGELWHGSTLIREHMHNIEWGPYLGKGPGAAFETLSMFEGDTVDERAASAVEEWREAVARTHREPR